MKVTKRILAIMMTMLMLLGTCAVAASAADSLQAAIDIAAAGDTVTMTGDTTESVVINKDLTLDLGGYELKSVPGSPAITVIGADVTITNGHVVSQFANVKSLTMLEMVVDESPAAINVKGGSVSVEGVRAVGSMTRIPTTSKYHFPTGSAVALTDGATAVIKQSSLVGRYGVNNKVTNATAGGEVEIEDAIMMGFMRAVKDSSKEIVPDDTEKVNAADRIEGFLNSGIKLEDRERNLLKRIFAERVMLYTKSVQDNATYTYSECTDKVTVEAHEDVSNIWQNNTSTDCSYKYVPEYVVLTDGTLVKMTAEGDKYTAEIDKDQAEEEIQIKYRLTFDMQPDIQGLTNNFNEYLEDLYAKVIKTAGEVYDYALEKYTNYTNLVGDILYKLDNMGSQKIAGKYIDEYEEFNRLRRAIVDLGGATVYNAAPREFAFGQDAMEAYYGAGAVMPADGIVGTIDRVAKLKNELETNYMPFSDQSKWADLGYWVYENYEEVIDIIDEALERIEALQNVLDGDIEKAIVEAAHLQDKRAALDKVQKITSDCKAALDRIMASSTVQYFIQKADSHKSELKPYINKFISIYNNHERYFTPSKFIVDGRFAKAYAVYGNVAENDPIEHAFGDWKDDKNDETHSRTCENCGATETVPHDLDTTITPATCTEDGSVVYSCDDCGYTKTEITPATNHNFGDWEYKDADSHERFCNNNGCDAFETEAHDYVEDPDAEGTVAATCTEGGVRVLVCKGCGDTKTETTDPNGHSWNGGEYTEPTCTEAGYTTYTCTACGETETEDGEAALGHDFEPSEWLISDTDPDNQHMRICDRCGEVFQYAAHDLDAVVTEATCTEAGSITYTCDVCGYTKTIKGDPTPGHTYGDWEYKDENDHERYCTVCGELDPDTEAHNYVEDPDAVGARPATCTEEGVRVLVCEGCGDVKTESIDKIDHSWDDGEYTEPTCTEAGYTTYTCTACGETKTEDGADALDHDFEPSEWLISDTDPEHQHMRICDRCGNEFDYADHDFDETGRVEPKCNAEGSITYTCKDCDYSYTETVGTLDHTPGDVKIENAVEPTCTKDGSHDEVVYCTVCGEELTRTTVVDPQTGHNYQRVETEPTCTEAGVITYTCQNDPTHTYTEPGKPALGHDWSEWTETKPATETEEGEETRTCGRCGETETRPIPKLAPEELTLTDSVTNQTPQNRISVKVPYSRRGKIAVTLTASEDDVTWTSSKPNLLTVDENGNVTFVRLCVFCRSATITATTPDGKTATAVVTIKLKWWQYIIYLLFGWLWF